jgi:KDO2-lipid IV(A) lauroyltransferase
MYVLFFYLAGYRKRVVFGNLRKSFPSKSDHELERIARDFYRHFCDVVVESIRLFSMSESEIKRRFVKTNPEIVNGFYEKGQHVIIIAGHYNNWEMAGITFSHQIRHHTAGIYASLNNAFFDARMIQSRKRFGVELVKKGEVNQFLSRPKDRPVALVFGADQSPTFSKRVYWMDFLNQESAVFFGPEKVAVEKNWPVIFARVRKVGRGFYEMDLEVIEENPRESDYGSITESHVRALEDQIRQRPEYWLWTHKRWKRTRKASEMWRNGQDESHRKAG